jgi:single-strand DNA-binding protein
VEGKLKTRNFEDKDGQKRYVTEIIAEQLILLDKKTDGN